MEEEIIVNKAWFERLSVLAEKVEVSQGDKREQNVNILLGYLSSIETILKYLYKK